MGQASNLSLIFPIRQARKNSPSDAVTLQAIRNTRGNSLCVWTVEHPYGSNVRAWDSLGQTALTLVWQKGSQECADILLQHGCPNKAPPTVSTPGLLRKSSTTSLSHANSRRGVS
ncbi:hypothetical protein AAFF_G00109190 [Aldrovandia affinis]|uniref:Uncharacterized protein n=1 Tax=Aldrovandia affinis TaxID=143900 RepID=A0AAD7WB73_9TELE|nr:hypothetical protein AAFF_G00109190 [Aldrovandia affinis]